jgi:hypothetical protein
VDAIKQVDIVISAVAFPQHLDQLNVIRAIKEIGNIKVYTQHLDQLNVIRAIKEIGNIKVYRPFHII